MAREKTDRTAQQRARWLRWVLLGVVLAGMTALVTAHQLVRGAGRWAGVDALCPFGGLETAYSLLTGSGFLKHTATSSVVLLLGMLALAVVYRRSFCGTLCPLGALQGIFGAAGRRLLRRRFTPPRAVDRAARLLKYVVLIVFAVWTWRAAELVLRPYDPWVAWAHLTTGDLLTTYLVGFVVLILSLAGSLIYDRFFCKYLCPTGALLGLLSRISLFGIRREAQACTSCGRCDKACMMNIPVSQAGTVASSECISCNECVNACPVKGALTVTAVTGRQTRTLVSTAVIVALTVAIVGGATLAGEFQWRQPSLAEATAGAATNGGGLDLSLIKGQTSLSEIVAVTGIPAAELTAAFGVPEADFDKPMSDIKDQYGFTPGAVRTWVTERLQQ